MRIKKFALVFSIVTLVFLMSCKKPETQKISKPIKKLKTETKLDETQIKEMVLLLNALKQKNPFRSDHFSTVPQTSSGSDLRGISWDSEKPFAIIGDRVVAAGDSLDGKKVIKINKDSVVLEEDGREIILRLE